MTRIRAAQRAMLMILCFSPGDCHAADAAAMPCRAAMLAPTRRDDARWHMLPNRCRLNVASITA